MKEANHLSILTVTRGGRRYGFQMRGVIEGFGGGGWGFLIPWFLGVENLTKYFFMWRWFHSSMDFFFLFLSVCLFLFACVWGNIIWLWLKPWVFFCLHPSLIPVTSNPNGATPPGYRTVSRQEEEKKNCFCNCMKERNIFFFGRYVIEGDWKNKGLPTTGATHLTTKHCWVETPKISHGNNESF